jgi:transcriptional regulator with XRE-family HTH domain
MSDEDIEKLGQRLKELRTERQLTMDMLVYDLNKKYNIEITKGNISRWESGKNIPSLRLAAYLCAYYGISLDYLIGNTDTRTPVELLKVKNVR